MPMRPTSLRPLLRTLLIAVLLAYASLLVPARSVATYGDIMGCESGCVVHSAGWPVPWFHDYLGMSVGNRVEVDPISLFAGPDRFVLSAFVPTLLFWLLLVDAVTRGLRRWRARAPRVAPPA